MTRQTTAANGGLALTLALAGLIAAGPPARADDRQDLLTAFARATELQKRSEYAEAAKYYSRALALAPRVFGDNHAVTANVLNGLAQVYEAQGRPAEALPLYRRVLAIRERVFNPNHLDVANSLYDLAFLCAEQGSHAEAEPLFQRALAIRERALGPIHLDVARCLSSLGTLYHTVGKYSEAGPLHRRALAIREKVRGLNHGEVAMSLNDLADLFRAEGRFAEAEPLHRRALAIMEKAFGVGHFATTPSLNGLAALHRARGNSAEAESLFRRVLAIQEKAFNPDHPVVAASVNAVANSCADQGKVAEAVQLFLRALVIYARTYGPDHATVAATLEDLGKLYYVLGKYAEAEPIYRRALAIQEKVFGPEHPTVAVSLHNLAAVNHARGNADDAEPLYRRSLAIDEKAFGPDHPAVAKCLTNLATLQVARNDWADAAELLDRQRRGVRNFIARELPGLAESEQLAFLKFTDEYDFHIALTLGLESRGVPDVAARSAAWLINGKFVAHQALAERALLERDATDAARRDLVRQLQDVRGRHAALALAAVKPGEVRGRSDQLAALDGRRRDLEQRLTAAGVAAAAPADPWVELADVRSNLPADGRLVEFVRFRPYNFAARQPLPPRYAAWVIPPAGAGEVRVVDLGPADAIEAAVAAARQAIDAAPGSSGDRASHGRSPSVAAAEERRAEAAARQPLGALAGLVLRPLIADIGGSERWFLSPDGALWLVPWAALPVDGAAYAVEKHAISLLGSGRELAAPPAPRKGGSTFSVVIADPNFDQSATDAAAHMKNLLPNYRTGPAGPRGLTPSARLPRVSALPGTAAEAQAVKPALQTYCGREPGLYLGGYALEAVAKSLRGPRVAVFSTHGFALPGQEVEDDGQRRAADAPPPARVKGGGALENPLLRCGLLLAGSNLRGEGTAEDGVLTGLEVVGMDLRGTELVVLSACETGLGDVKGGEGVAGLRQAFQLAGARAVVATLWQVPDRESAELTAAFFDGLAAGRPKADALRSGQLQMIASRRERNAAAHPFFWAAYTLTGQ